MASNQSINEPANEPHLFEGGETAPSKWIKFGALACALAVAAALLIGYRLLRARQLESVRAAQQAAQVTKVVAPPEAQIFEDEARLKGSDAVITGTIRNISDKRLEDLSVELELKRRTGQATERRQIDVAPASLDPGAEGRYSLNLRSSEWGGARVLSLNSAKRSETIAFKSAVGARRQPERLPQGNPKIVVVPRPRPTGEEFINTPDNPTRIP
ncbi:MAG TPA: hypothetical protein VGB76_03930 [Pyrinomonadaceae bacterium]|jgi:hypothetical protein